MMSLVVVVVTFNATIGSSYFAIDHMVMHPTSLDDQEEHYSVGLNHCVQSGMTIVYTDEPSKATRVT